MQYFPPAYADHDIFTRTCIDTDLLYRLSVVLNTDFFAYYSAHLKM